MTADDLLLSETESGCPPLSPAFIVCLCVCVCVCVLSHVCLMSVLGVRQVSGLVFTYVCDICAVWQVLLGHTYHANEDAG